MNLFLPFKKGFQILPVSPFFMPMSYKTYSEKLRDPRWQKKRLEILQRDNFACLLCNDNKTELQIHHKKYIKGHEPWDYGNENFQTLCKHCHCLSEYEKGYGEILIVAKSFSNDTVITFSIVNRIEDGLICNITSHDKGGDTHIIAIHKKDIKYIGQLLEKAEKVIS